MLLSEKGRENKNKSENQNQNQNKKRTRTRTRPTKDNKFPKFPKSPQDSCQLKCLTTPSYFLLFSTVLFYSEIQETVEEKKTVDTVLYVDRRER